MIVIYRIGDSLEQHVLPVRGGATIRPRWLYDRSRKVMMRWSFPWRRIPG